MEDGSRPSIVATTAEAESATQVLPTSRTDASNAVEADHRVRELVGLVLADERAWKGPPRTELITHGPRAAAVLGQVINNGNANERAIAIDILSQLGATAGPAVPALLTSLDALDDDSRFIQALETIAKAEPATFRSAKEVKAAFPRVLRLAEVGEVPVASGAVVLLAGFDVDPGVAAGIIARHPLRVQEWIENTDADSGGAWGKAIASVYALRGLGRRVVPELLEVARADDDFRVRASALQLLETSKLADASDVPRLKQVLADPDPLVRKGAVDVLSPLGPQARKALPQLRTIAANDPDEDVRKAAASAANSVAGRDQRR